MERQQHGSALQQQVAQMSPHLVKHRRKGVTGVRGGHGREEPCQQQLVDVSVHQVKEGSQGVRGMTGSQGRQESHSLFGQLMACCVIGVQYSHEGLSTGSVTIGHTTKLDKSSSG